MALESAAVDKPLLRALAGEVLSVPPIWLMRQAGRYLPEYRALRDRSDGFLKLCYTPELAAEATLQPVRRFGFDAAILFADILLVAQALGANLSFENGAGPKLSPITDSRDLPRLKPASEIHETLMPVYQTIRLVSAELPGSVAMLGFAGAPWTVATYMIAGKGEPSQATAKRFMRECPKAFESLIDLLTEATIIYLDRQIKAGAEAYKLFDSWAGALSGIDFERFVAAPTARIVGTIKMSHPHIPAIVFPRQAGPHYAGFAARTVADCIALDSSIDPVWAARKLQPHACVQGNLDPAFLVTGGERLVIRTRQILAALRKGPFIFNLGHGITPDAKPENVDKLIDIIRTG